MATKRHKKEARTIAVSCDTTYHRFSVESLAFKACLSVIEWPQCKNTFELHYHVYIAIDSSGDSPFMSTHVSAYSPFVVVIGAGKTALFRN